MANKAGINKAQNNVFDQSDSAISGRTNGDTFSYGSVDQPGFNPATGNFWYGTANPNIGNNITRDAKGGVETALSVKHRGGAPYTPVHDGPNGEKLYKVNAGTQPGNANRAEWNFNYDVITGADHAVTDLAGTPGLSDHDFRMQIVQSGPQFLTAKTAIFTLDAATHVWTDENNPSVAFGGDDFQPGSAASADVMAHVATNSVNLAFLAKDFGLLATSTAVGTQYDIQLTGFKAGTGNLETYTHDHITLVTPSV